MKFNRLSLQPRQYYELKEPLKIFLDKKITQSQLELMLEAFAKRKTPLIISGKANKDKARFGEWTYQIQMPGFTLHMGEGNDGKPNFSTFKFLPGSSKGYHNRFAKMFFISVEAGIYLIFKGSTYAVVPDGGWSRIPQEDNPQWTMSEEIFDDLIQRMRDYFNDEAEYERSQRVSDRMRENVLDNFDRYTEKEHEFETRKVDFTKGIRYQNRIVAGLSRGKKSCFTLISNDTAADPESCNLAVGQQVAIYSEDQQYSGLNGLLVEIDDTAEDGVHFVLEFYQQFDLPQLPQSGYLFIHQNDTQYRIRKAVSRSINRGKTPAKYMYRTFHDYSVAGYESLQSHPELVKFLHSRMGKMFPPNQMQLEAIVKGILTEDLLLVLGPPGTGKTTVILSWVEYFLSKGLRVLISSQNNAAVDNVLERLGKDENREIIRLGREEKVQGNCTKFIPYNRVKSMRKSCEANSQKLRSRIGIELEQMQTYRKALERFAALLDMDSDIQEALKHSLGRMDHLCRLIKRSHQECIQQRKALTEAKVKLRQYTIFLEESSKKGLLGRLLELPHRIKAQKKAAEAAEDVAVLEPKLKTSLRQYENGCASLQTELQLLRQERLLERCTQIQGWLQEQQDLILGSGSTPGLTPSFQSVLQELDCLRQFKAPTAADLKNRKFLTAHIATMEQVRAAAEKILAASESWVQAALSGDRNEVFEDILLESCQVVGATCVGINSNKRFSTVDFDVTIIDESGQIQLHNALIPMSRSPKTLMLGDYKQIPPIVNDEIMDTCRKEGIDTSLYGMSFFEYLFEQMRKKEINRLASHYQRQREEDDPEVQRQCVEQAKAEILKPRAADYIGKPLSYTTTDAGGTAQTVYYSRYTEQQVAKLVQDIIDDQKKIVNLNSQFRMPGNISDVISQWFYESNYFSSYDMAHFKPVVPGTSLPMVVIDTSRMRNRFEARPANNMGYQNPTEAALVADVLEAMLRRMSKQEQAEYLSALGDKLGVISAYGAQVRHIRQVLCRRLRISAAEAATAVASLDSFQGQERDLIIYSLTRSDRKRSTQARVGFLKELRRLNVAFTRCKKQLVIIGDLDYLQSCLYLPEGTDAAALPCAQTADDRISQQHIDQCADCTVDCERRFSRFFRLLMQHVKSKEPAGDLIPGEKLDAVLRGER